MFSNTDVEQLKVLLDPLLRGLLEEIKNDPHIF
jgi:hypothetical protein